MDLDLGPEIAQYRAELRDWISAEAPEGLAELTDWNLTVIPGGYRDQSLGAALAHPAYAEWEQKLAAARLICPQWPSRSAGRAWTGSRVAVLNEEFHRAGVPGVCGAWARALVGPSIIVHGTDEQRAHFLPRIIAGEDTLLPGVLGARPRLGPRRGRDPRRRRRRRDRGHRPEGVDLGRAPGEHDVRPVPDRPGRAQAPRPVLRAGPVHRATTASSSGRCARCRARRSSAEDFLDGARAPLFNVIGGLEQRLAGGDDDARARARRPGHDRVPRATSGSSGTWSRSPASTARSATRWSGSDLAWAYTQVQLMRFAGLRDAGPVAEGSEPGPEASVSKLFWSEYHKRLGEIAIDIIGADGHDPAGRARLPRRPSGRTCSCEPGRHDLLRDQRDPADIIGERALGLPKEPKAPGQDKAQSGARP